MSNLNIALNYGKTMIGVTNTGGVTAFAMFPGATKHDLRKLEKEFMADKRVKSVEINKKFVVINVK